MTNINTPIMGPQHMPTVWALSYSFFYNASIGGIIINLQYGPYHI